MVIHGEKGDCDFCATNGLVIEETLFPHKRSRKLICRDHLGRIYENQIAHVAQGKT